MYIPVQDQQALGGVALSPTQATGPLFRLDCTAGCAPIPPFACRTVLRTAILDAIRLASDAAGKLEASPRDRLTVSEFRSFFGHDPWLRVPLAGNRESGAIVARRFRMAENALRRGGALGTPGTRYRCDPCTATEPPAPDIHARAILPNEVRLCPSFWSRRLSRFLKAGVVLHEMLHLVFGQFFDHSPSERRRNNAYCYEAFALRVAGQTPEKLACDRCLARPA